MKFNEFSLKFVENQRNFNKIHWVLLEFYCIYWYFLFFNVSPLGPAGEMGKKSIFCTFGSQLDRGRKTIFLSTGEIGWSNEVNWGRFWLVSYSICQNPTLFWGARNRRGDGNRESKTAPRGYIGIQNVTNLNTSVSGLYLKSLMFFRLPLQTSP